MQNLSIKVFRSDIEGLRGVAVLAVLLFHFQLLGLNGGFIGVDIFFVLSGYLMTQIVMSSQFVWSPASILSFYRKRFWRIAPAYYVVLVCTMIVIFLTGWTHGLADLYRGLVSAIFFGYNITAPSNAGYFVTSASFLPFLHTWSLGVEVQFYLIWPFVCLGLLKCSLRNRLFVLLFICVFSFIASSVLVFQDPEVAYFSLPTRLWQFALGAFAVVLSEYTHNKPLNRLMVSCGQLAALSTICVLSILAQGEGWPSGFALGLVLSVAYLLFTAHMPGAWVSSFLSAQPLRLIGKISYSLYLVHWPIFVLSYSLIDGFTDSFSLRLSGLLGSVILAIGLYAFIERPARGVGAKKPRFSELVPPFVFISVLLISSYFISGLSQMRLIFPERNLLHISEKQFFTEFAENNCTAKYWGGHYCLIGDQSKGAPKVVLWGDSHAEHFGFGMNDVYQKRGQPLALFQYGGCPPVPAIGSLLQYNISDRCEQHNRRVVRHLKTNIQPRIVYLAAYWSSYIRGSGSEEKEVEAKQFFGRLEELISELDPMQTRFVLLNQAPQLTYSDHLLPCKFGGAIDEVRCSAKIDEIENKNRVAKKYLLKLSERYSNVDFLDPKGVLCQAGRCRLSSDGNFFYRDLSHLNLHGSRYLAERLF